MHIPDGFVSGAINGAMFCVSGAVVGLALARAKKTLQEHEVPLLGVTGAFVFAAQMVNFPIGMGTSGHFLGALLAAILLGPLNAALVLSLVLGLQCLLFADGGVTALGTNIFNMGIVGGTLSYGFFVLVKGILPRTRMGFLTASAIASWFSVVVAATVCSVELAASGTVPFQLVFPAMVGVHGVIGIGEALITASTLSVVLAARPDLVRAWSLSPPRALEQTA